MPDPTILPNPARRRLSVRALMVAVALVAVLIAGGKWIAWQVEVYGKVQYCRGWGLQHAEQAREFRKKAADPKLPPDEDRGYQSYRMQARQHAIKARKYLAVADDPSLSYPGTPYPNNPIITVEEIAREPDLPADP